MFNSFRSFIGAIMTFPGPLLDALVRGVGCVGQQDVVVVEPDLAAPRHHLLGVQLQSSLHAVTGNPAAVVNSMYEE